MIKFLILFLFAYMFIAVIPKSLVAIGLAVAVKRYI